ncbi:UNKNOWN [Stylonychia lemnae]|uniref:Uncharacterized protein n=1 Tax=Stylonychia lemnae TaxID=5949 RepID=A0A078B9L9_STYLE|nr:UNKNOWN [Stylonychia lemnae]|eukprot:CDW91230.1 UNKNOWN [Stylonychia lemnae]
MDIMMKHQLNQKNQTMKQANKNDVVIYNQVMPEVDYWQGRNNQFMPSQSLDQSQLFNDSKFVGYDQNNIQINTAQFQTDTASDGANVTPNNNILPSNSIQLSLENFKSSSNLVQLPPQTLPNTEIISHLQPQFEEPQIILPPLQFNHQLIAQYEQVMQLMHQEIQTLLHKNKDLQEQAQINESRQNLTASVQEQSNIQQFQQMMKEKDDLIETLRQREQVIMSLRVELDIMNQSNQELQQNQNSQQQYQNLSEQQLKNRNDQLLDKVRKLEKQNRDYEQQNFELEQMTRQLQRDLKNQSIINDQMRQETQDINIKREQGDLLVQEVKNKLCQNLIQTRQLQSVIDNQIIELTNLQNIRGQQEKFLEQANHDIEQLRDQLNESEGIKLGQFQIMERKEREIQNLRAMVRRFLALIETHREEFGELQDVNYDLLFKDVSNSNISFQLPPSQYHHLQSSAHKHVKFEGSVGPAYKSKPQKQSTENEDYYGMVEKLTQYVREKSQAGTSNQSFAQSQGRQRSPNRSYNEADYTMPKSILKNQNQSMQSEPQASPQISWVSSTVNSGQTNHNQSQQQLQKPRGKSPDRKPNVEGLKATLASLIEEKNNLEKQLRAGDNRKPQDDLKFEIDLAANNIKRIQEKIQAASQ